MKTYQCEVPCWHDGHRYRRGDVVDALPENMPWRWADKEKTKKVLAHFVEIEGGKVVPAPAVVEGVKVKKVVDVAAGKKAPALKPLAKMNTEELTAEIATHQDVKSIEGLKRPALMEILKGMREIPQGRV